MLDRGCPELRDGDRGTLNGPLGHLQTVPIPVDSDVQALPEYACAFSVKLQDSSHHSVRRPPRAANFPMQCRGPFVQTIARAAQLVSRSTINLRRSASAYRALQGTDHRLLCRLLAMDFKTERIETNRLQTTVNNI